MSQRQPAPARARPLRLVCSLLHAGYLRHYGEPLRLLAERGHEVRIMLGQPHLATADARLLDELVDDCPRITWARAPRRSRFDGWRPLAWLTRGLVDVLRYSDPQLAFAAALRRRAVDHVESLVRTRSRDPFTQRLVAGPLAALLARPSPRRDRRLLRFLLAVERAIPPSPRVVALLEHHRADVVLASPVVEIGSAQVEFVKAARHLGIPSAVCVASWDNLTSKGLLRVAPDRVLVWNELQRRELTDLHDIDPATVVVTGGQKFDAWFELEPRTSFTDFTAEVGLVGSRAYVLYLCSSSFVAPEETRFVRKWVDALRSSSDEHVRSLGVLVRPHPQKASSWAACNFSDLDAVAVWPKVGTFPDPGDAQQQFFDAMFHSSAVVGITTSAQIDAAILGRPVLTVRDPEFAAAQEETVHHGYLLREHGGFVQSADTLGEHVAQLASVLAEGRDVERPELTAFVSTFVRPRGPALPVAPIVADEIELVASVPSARVGRWHSLLLRLALTPAALVLTAASLLAELVARTRRIAARARPDQS